MIQKNSAFNEDFVTLRTNDI